MTFGGGGDVGVSEAEEALEVGDRAEQRLGNAVNLKGWNGHSIGLQGPVSHSTVTAQSPHSHRTVTAQSQHSHSG